MSYNPCRFGTYLHEITSQCFLVTVECNDVTCDGRWKLGTQRKDTATFVLSILTSLRAFIELKDDVNKGRRNGLKAMKLRGLLLDMHLRFGG